MTIVLRGDKKFKDSWNGIWIVDVRAYHHNEKRATILFQCFLENKLEDNVENYLYALHEGNITAKLINPWPMPFHPDENRTAMVLEGSDEQLLPFDLKHEDSLLQRLYGESFAVEGENVYWQKALAPWQAWYDLKQKKVVNVWPDKNTEGYIEQHFLEIVPNGFIPYTILRFGPFTKKGPTLFNFLLEINSDSYDKLIGADTSFYDGGSSSVLARIRHWYIAFGKYSEREKRYWEKELSKFGYSTDKRYIDFSDKYEIVLLKNPGIIDDIFVDKIGSTLITDHSFGIERYAQRFLTGEPNFHIRMSIGTHKKVEENG